jgi:hypothetical protein
MTQMGDQGPGIRQLQLLLWLSLPVQRPPTHGQCRGLAVLDIDKGVHGETLLMG